MMQRAGLALIAAWAAIAAPAAAQREPVLVPEVSQSLIEVRQGFTGANLLLYGAVIDPAGAGRAGDYDIVVVLKGPTAPIRIREKERLAGIWMNSERAIFVLPHHSSRSHRRGRCAKSLMNARRRFTNWARISSSSALRA